VWWWRFSKSNPAPRYNASTHIIANRESLGCADRYTEPNTHSDCYSDRYSSPTRATCHGRGTAAHPLGWEFGTSSANGKPVGKQTITVAFADGTISSSHAYIYDGWTIACNAGFAYVGGVPVAQATKATSDVYADCTNNNLVFPMGAVLYSQPVQDQFGLTQTIMPTITAAIAFVVSNVNYPMPSTIGGQVYGIATRDGGFAKIYLTAGAGQGLLSSASGMSLHANVDGTYPF
jgi:hypothetical protein